MNYEIGKQLKWKGKEAHLKLIKALIFSHVNYLIVSVLTPDFRQIISFDLNICTTDL